MDRERNCRENSRIHHSVIFTFVAIAVMTGLSPCWSLGRRALIRTCPTRSTATALAVGEATHSRATATARTPRRFLLAQNQLRRGDGVPVFHARTHKANPIGVVLRHRPGRWPDPATGTARRLRWRRQVTEEALKRGTRSAGGATYTGTRGDTYGVFSGGGSASTTDVSACAWPSKPSNPNCGGGNRR